MSFEGIYCPVVTTFKTNRFDSAAFGSNIEKLLSCGLAGFVILGSTGESVTLSMDEKAEIVRLARRCVPTESGFIVGTGAEATEKAIELTNRAAEWGADYALVITPGYFKSHLSSLAYSEHFQQIADRSPIPIIIYNVPKFTGLDLDVSVISELSTHRNICGIKDSTSNVTKLHELMPCCSETFSILIGNAGMLWVGLLLGAQGAILALSNFAGKACVEIFDLLREQKHEAAQLRFLKILPVAKRIVGQYGIPAIKAAMDMVGYHGGEPRRPLLPADQETTVEIAALLRQAELIQKYQMRG
ncbi:MAG: dihydrodipicolinate synthase family protein [bacterium]